MKIMKILCVGAIIKIRNLNYTVFGISSISIKRRIGAFFNIYF